VKKKNVACACLVAVDRALAPYHTRISLTHVMMKSGFVSLPTVLTEKVPNAPRGTRPKVIYPNYCTFCGKPYPKPETEPVPKVAS